MAKKNKKQLSTYAILLIVLLVVSILTWLAAGKSFHGYDKEGNLLEGTVTGANLGIILMAPIRGFLDGGEVIGFVFCLGYFLAMVNATGALEAGIHALVRKMKGRETHLIVILMLLFAIGGTTYGMCEETVGFYLLMAATMTAAGMDPLVGAATVLLGAGVGCLGSTINPFATVAAVDAARAVNVEINMGDIIGEGLVMLVVAWVLAVLYVLSYAKKVLKEKHSLFLSEQEMEECKKAYGETNIDETPALTGKQKICLWLFGIAFIVMIIGFIPWPLLGSFGEGVYNALHWTGFLFNMQLGDWYMQEGGTWFAVMGTIIGLIGVSDKRQFPKIAVSGFADMIGVNLVIALARATSIVMSETGFGYWLVESAVSALQSSGMGAGMFGFLDYLLHIGLSFLVPSTSGLAALSSPIVAPIVQGMGWNPAASTMIEVGANGLINLFAPTAGAMMGGLALARVPYTTYLKFSWKLIVEIFIATGIIVVLGMIIL